MQRQGGLGMGMGAFSVCILKDRVTEAATISKNQWEKEYLCIWIFKKIYTHITYTYCVFIRVCTCMGLCTHTYVYIYVHRYRNCAQWVTHLKWTELEACECRWTGRRIDQLQFVSWVRVATRRAASCLEKWKEGQAVPASCGPPRGCSCSAWQHVAPIPTEQTPLSHSA